MSIPSENKAILFVRHADVDKDNDHTLSEAGIQQAIFFIKFIIFIIGFCHYYKYNLEINVGSRFLCAKMICISS